jgi:hypothetical protein
MNAHTGTLTRVAREGRSLIDGGGSGEPMPGWPRTPTEAVA